MEIRREKCRKNLGEKIFEKKYLEEVNRGPQIDINQGGCIPFCIKTIHKDGKACIKVTFCYFLVCVCDNLQALTSDA